MLRLKFWTTTRLQRLPKPATRPPLPCCSPKGGRSPGASSPPSPPAPKSAWTPRHTACSSCVDCRCGAHLDSLGDHRAACPRAGLLRSRGVPLERAAARVCREAGATVAANVLLRDLNVIAQRHDDRRLEVIANGLPLWGGVQLAVDTTLVSALDASGRPRWHQRRTLGAALRIARLAKERTYPERIRAQRCRLVVLAIEVAGRWSSEAVEFVRLLARSRARSAPAHLRASCVSACSQRWSGILAFAAARAFAASLQSAPCMAQPMSMARSQPSAISSPKSATGQTALSPAAALRGGEGPPARPAGRVSWTFPTPCGQPAVSFGLGLRTGTAWIGLKKVREKKRQRHFCRRYPPFAWQPPRSRSSSPCDLHCPSKDIWL